MKEETIEYRYLNMDTSLFADSYVDLIKQVGRGAMIRVALNSEYKQILYAAGHNPFNESTMIRQCKELSGMI